MQVCYFNPTRKKTGYRIDSVDSVPALEAVSTNSVRGLVVLKAQYLYSTEKLRLLEEPDDIRGPR